MLDDEARRTLEEEAIALVSLSNPSASLHFRRTEQRSDSSGRAPLLCVPQHLHHRHHAQRQQSQQLHAKPGLAALKSGPPARAVDARDELYAQNPAGDALQQQQQSQTGISMRSLLVTLKKRKLSTAAPPTTDDAAKVLPSFRDVFEASHPQSQASSTAAGTAEPADPRAATAAAAVVPTQVLSAAELKCKYRTGKCSNVRALKSCGDYHNLCNYHRLRANANQRKLDRKKKTQRLHVPEGGPPTTGTGPASVAAAASALLCAPSAAAAAALVSMPTSAPAVKREADRTSTNSHSGTRIKHEDACS